MTHISELIGKTSPTKTSKKSKFSTRAGKRIVLGVSFILMLLASFTMVLPFVWMVSTSLKHSRAAFSYPPQWIPEEFDWGNYLEVWGKGPLAEGLLNSTIVSVLVVVVGTLSSTMAAFAFAKLHFPFKNAAFLMLLASMMVPVVVILVPQFAIYAQVGWIDTLLPLAVPGMLGNVVMIFFLRQYMMGLPDELMNAAKIDGAGYFRTYWSIFLPMCKPAIAANVIIVFMGTWNDYLGPLIYTNSPERSTVQLVIASFMSFYEEQTDFPIVMAASVIAVLPVLIVFIALQKHFINSFALSGIKG